MSNSRLLAQFDLETQPDDIKKFPSDIWRDGFHGVFIIATYNYDQRTHLRHGELLCFNPLEHIECLSSGKDSQPPNFYKYRGPLPGILKCSWLKRDEGYGVACITSDLKVLKFDINCDGHDSYELIKAGEIDLQNESGAVGISFSLSDDAGSCISATDSSGNVYLIKDSVLRHKWKAHELEIWTSTFQPENDNIIYTGSDDMLIKIFDLREGVGLASSISHSSGVTTLQFSNWDHNLLYTGGFDKRLVLYDTRYTTLPVANYKLEGPIWYIDFIYEKQNLLLNIASCQDGSFVYRLQDDLQIKKIKSYTPSDSLIYSSSHIHFGGGICHLATNFYKKTIDIFQ